LKFLSVSDFCTAWKYGKGGVFQHVWRAPTAFNKLLGTDGVHPGALQELKGEIAVLLLVMRNFSFKIVLAPRSKGWRIRCQFLERTWCEV